MDLLDNYLQITSYYNWGQIGHFIRLVLYVGVGLEFWPVIYDVSMTTST